MMKKLIHNVLGTPYTVLFGDREELEMSEDYMGTTKVFLKEILVHTGLNECSEKEREVRVSETLAHEIFHAYLNEAGLSLDEGVEEQLADFYMKNWRKMNNSILEVLDENGFLDN